MTKHIAMWALLGASVLNSPEPAVAQERQSRSVSWDCATSARTYRGRQDYTLDQEGSMVTRCVLDMSAAICVVVERETPGEWTHRVSVYTRGPRSTTGWGRVDAVIHRDGTIVPEVRWWTQETRDLHGNLPEGQARERMRTLIQDHCSTEQGLNESRAIALRNVRAFSERVQHAEGSTSATEASRP